MIIEVVFLIFYTPSIKYFNLLLTDKDVITLEYFLLR